MSFRFAPVFLRDDKFFSYLRNQNQNLEIEWVFDSTDGRIEKRLLGLSKYFRFCHLSIPVCKQLDWNPIVHSLVFESFSDIHLYFDYQFSDSGTSMDCKQVHKLIGLLEKKFPEKTFLPPKGVDLWDPRAHHDFNMEPYILPCFETRSKNPEVQYSVIIPTFNNQNHLQVVIKHLYQQNIGPNAFEIIVVDDGSTDQTQSLLMELLDSFTDSLNFKYIFFPRSRKRVMGDFQYRAGISRNLGVKNAVGEILCFLDSDIVIPRDYLQKVGKALEAWDGVQAKRIQLSQKASHLDFQYGNHDPGKDTTTTSDYLKEFIETPNWHLLPFNWKYVCTYGFSIRRELFWKLGGIRKNFICYGFEDVELGYRLVKRGYRLHLLDLEVFHLFHEDERSEFSNLQSLRHRLLTCTAQIFYLHHLDKDIYKDLLVFMGPEPISSHFIHSLIKILSLQFLWKPKEKVYSSLLNGNAMKAAKKSQATPSRFKDEPSPGIDPPK